jgi:hypothetical protein
MIVCCVGPSSFHAAHLDRATPACRLAGAELAALVHACVRFEHQPSPLWLQLMVSEASTSLNQMPVASSTLLLKSLAALGHDPGAIWLRNYCSVMSERMHECSPADLVKVRGWSGPAVHVPGCTGSLQLKSVPDCCSCVRGQRLPALLHVHLYLRLCLLASPVIWPCAQ